MAGFNPHPDYYHNYPTATAPEEHHEVTGAEEHEVGDLELGVEPLDEGTISCRPKHHVVFRESGNDVANRRRIEHVAGRRIDVAPDRADALVAADRPHRAERHQDVASGQHHIEADLSDSGSDRASARNLLEERPNKKQYTHTCVCTEKQASAEAKQVSYYFVLLRFLNISSSNLTKPQIGSHEIGIAG